MKGSEYGQADAREPDSGAIVSEETDDVVLRRGIVRGEGDETGLVIGIARGEFVVCHGGIDLTADMGGGICEQWRACTTEEGVGWPAARIARHGEWRSGQCLKGGAVSV